ncbi:MAG: hypothetical protein DRN35_03650, partial [Thermoplasmata archaeon]
PLIILWSADINVAGFEPKVFRTCREKELTKEVRRQGENGLKRMKRGVFTVSNPAGPTFNNSVVSGY